MSETCKWTYDEEHDSWETGCGKEDCPVSDEQTYSDYRYCPFCGKALAKEAEG